MDNVEEMDKFFKRDNHPRLNQEEIELQTEDSQVMKLKL